MDNRAPVVVQAQRTGNQKTPMRQRKVGRCARCVGGREGVWGRVFYFSQLLWKELQELKSKEQN